MAIFKYNQQLEDNTIVYPYTSNLDSTIIHI